MQSSKKFAKTAAIVTLNMVFPGAGTLMEGRIAAATTQILLAVTGAFLVFANAAALTQSGSAAAMRSASMAVLVGFGLVLVAYAYALLIRPRRKSSPGQED